MKKLVIAACAAVLAMGLAACSGGSGTNEPADASADVAAEASAQDAEEAATSPEAAQAEEPAAEEQAAEPAAEPVDVSAVDFDVAAMSNEEAFQFMHDFANRTPDEKDADEGKVMHIIGQASRYVKNDDDGRHVSCSVGIKGEGGTIWGVNFYVDGWGEDDYPENKAQIEVTGVWGKVDGYGNDAGRALICNAEDVKVLEA